MLVLYVIFLLAYSVTAMNGRHDHMISPYTIYDMQKALMDQLTGESLGVSYVDSMNTTLSSVSTVKDMYSWLRTTFHYSIYSAATFDGDPRFRGGGRNGFVFGQLMLLGGIRISQERSKKEDCKDRAPEGLFADLYQTYTEADLNETLTPEDVTDDEQVRACGAPTSEG